MTPDHSPTATPAFTVETVETIDGFRALRAAWEALQPNDVETTPFLSWAWLEKVFAANPYRWSVHVVRLANRPEEAVCILPLKSRVHWSSSRQEMQTELEAGGRLIWSEYTGLICNPVHESTRSTRRPPTTLSAPRSSWRSSGRVTR